MPSTLRCLRPAAGGADPVPRSATPASKRGTGPHAGSRRDRARDAGVRTGPAWQDRWCGAAARTPAGQRETAPRRAPARPGGGAAARGLSGHRSGRVPNGAVRRAGRRPMGRAPTRPHRRAGRRPRARRPIPATDRVFGQCTSRARNLPSIRTPSHRQRRSHEVGGRTIRLPGHHANVNRDGYLGRRTMRLAATPRPAR